MLKKLENKDLERSCQSELVEYFTLIRTLSCKMSVFMAIVAFHFLFSISFRAITSHVALLMATEALHSCFGCITFLNYSVCNHEPYDHTFDSCNTSLHYFDDSFLLLLSFLMKLRLLGHSLEKCPTPPHVKHFVSPTSTHTHLPFCIILQSAPILHSYDKYYL